MFNLSHLLELEISSIRVYFSIEKQSYYTSSTIKHLSLHVSSPSNVCMVLTRFSSFTYVGSSIIFFFFLQHMGLISIGNILGVICMHLVSFPHLEKLSMNKLQCGCWNTTLVNAQRPNRDLQFECSE